MMRLMITSMGSTASQNLVRHLRRSEDDWFVVGVDAAEHHGGLGLADVDRQVPRGDDPDYVAAVGELAEEYEIDLVIPVLGPELEAASGAVSELEASGATVLVSPAEAIEVCGSKRQMARRFEALGVDTPKLLDPESVTEFPVFVRPEFGDGSKGARRVPNRMFLDYYLEQDPQLVVTEFVDGREFSIDGFVDERGRLIHAVCRERKDVRGGLSVRTEVVDLGARRETVARIVSDIGVWGFFNLQFRKTASGRETYFDLNPRLGGAMTASFEAGLEPDRLLHGLFEPQRLEGAFETRVGLELFRRWENLYIEPPEGGP